MTTPAEHIAATLPVVSMCSLPEPAAGSLWPERFSKIMGDMARGIADRMEALDLEIDPESTLTVSIDRDSELFVGNEFRLVAEWKVRPRG